MGIPKMCLKQSFSYFKWALQGILFLTVELCFCFVTHECFSYVHKYGTCGGNTTPAKLRSSGVKTQSWGRDGVCMVGLMRPQCVQDTGKVNSYSTSS